MGEALARDACSASALFVPPDIEATWVEVIDAPCSAAVKVRVEVMNLVMRDVLLRVVASSASETLPVDADEAGTAAAATATLVEDSDKTIVEVLVTMEPVIVAGGVCPSHLIDPASAL